MPAANPRPRPALGAWLARGIAAVAGILCFAVLPAWLGWETRAVAAWDLGVLVLVGEGWFVILRSDPQRARERAVAEDPGRAALLAVAFGASAISLVAAVAVITKAEMLAPNAPAWLRTTLGLTAIIAAWTLLHTAFTLHYARLYYGDPEMTNSLEFRGGQPDDADFAYFSFGIGMTFQIPDVDVTTREMRRVVLFHQLISFAYNTAILALVVNLLAGLF
jgi:uncharacterized membrane protein